MNALPERPGIPPQFAAPAQKFAQLPALRLHYLEWGAGPRALVCLHGTSMSAHCWVHLATALRERYRVIALDMRGHGLSDRAKGGYAIRDYRDDLAAFFDAIGLSRAALVGSSVGTQVAIAFAAAHPERTCGLVLSDPSCTIEQETIDGYVKLHRERPRSFASFAEACRFARSLPQRAGLAGDHIHLMTETGDFVRRPDGRWEWAYDLPAILETFAGLTVDQWDEVRAVRAPVLILHAEHSHVLRPQNARRLQAAFPDARLVEMQGSSHTIWGDRPEELARYAGAHLDALTW